MTLWQTCGALLIAWAVITFTCCLFMKGAHDPRRWFE